MGTTSRKFKYFIVVAAFLALVTDGLAEPARAADPLPSWNNGASKKAIVSFVDKVTKAGSGDFVAPEGRIAVFDNDGTLWAEQPMYFQFLFMLDRVKALAPQHPEWQTTEPFASLLKGDVKGGRQRRALLLVHSSHRRRTRMGLRP